MDSPGDAVAVTVDGDEISLHDVLAAAKFYGQIDFVTQAIDAALIRRAAARLRIEISDAELQAAADDFRTHRELYEAKKTEAWLAAQHLSQEDWELQLEGEILRRRLRQLLTEGKIDQHFAENKRAWEAATVSWIVIADENIARELRAQAAENEADFGDLARQYSLEDATPRRCRRQDLDAPVAAAIFGVTPGEVAGPVRSERGWLVMRVEAFHPARLDQETRDEIAELLFAEWMDAEKAKAGISTPILDI